MSSSPEAASSPASTFRMLDLFSGIGGFSLAGRWAGFRTVGFCEIELYCQYVLRKNFPGVPIWDDIKTLRGDHVRQWVADSDERLGQQGTTPADPQIVQRIALDGYQSDGDIDVAGTVADDGRPVHDAVRGRHGSSDEEVPTGRNAVVDAGIDLITGGFPCQPVSLAGRRKGAEDDRWLWAEMARVVADVRPRWVLAENTPGLISMGLDDCLFDLESLGYEAWTVVLPACALGAWHRRDRVWVVAHAERPERRPITEGRDVSDRDDAGRQEATGWPGAGGETCRARIVADADGAGCEQQRRAVAGAEFLRPAQLDGWWKSEPGVGRVATGIPRRVDRLRGLGNAIVPRVAYEIMRSMV